MNNVTIARILQAHKKTKGVFKGVFASDRTPLSKPKYKPACYVINLDPLHLPRIHWVAVYLDSYGVN